MRTAANWAIAEKNSPNPAWSDRFHHYWSGWCEQFASQAEGFPNPSFGSATEHYNWQRGQGRIHTDTNHPSQCRRLLDRTRRDQHRWRSGRRDFRHPGDRYPVRQYAVVGGLSNKYLGWARPIGS
jgi:hypothetical protein